MYPESIREQVIATTLAAVQETCSELTFCLFLPEQDQDIQICRNFSRKLFLVYQENTHNSAFTVDTHGVWFTLFYSNRADRKRERLREYHQQCQQARLEWAENAKYLSQLFFLKVLRLLPDQALILFYILAHCLGSKHGVL